MDELRNIHRKYYVVEYHKKGNFPINLDFFSKKSDAKNYKPSIRNNGGDLIEGKDYTLKIVKKQVKIL
jgi:hypothetical protein